MGAKRSPDGRRTGMTAKFSDSETAEIDAARRGQERGVFLREAALAAARRINARGVTGRPVPGAHQARDSS